MLLTSAFLTAGLCLQTVMVKGLSITGDPTSIVNQSFDFVVVGGGTAGKQPSSVVCAQYGDLFCFSFRTDGRKPNS